MSLSLPSNLTQGELQFIKYALGFNQLTVGAEPYVGITRYFEQIVLPNLFSGSVSTSGTNVQASAPGPTPVTLVLADASGFAMFDHVQVDVDAAQEGATVMSVSGNTVTLQLAKAHGQGGPYPVECESGQSIIRQHIAWIRKIDDRVFRFGARAGVKKADEIEFFGGSHGRAAEANGFQTLGQMQEHFRKELCMLLFGCGSVQEFNGSGSRIAQY
jgi:hypothetical protein